MATSVDATLGTICKSCKDGVGAKFDGGKEDCKECRAAERGIGRGRKVARRVQRRGARRQTPVVFSVDVSYP